MRATFLLVAAMAVLFPAEAPAAAEKTVCTITVNSPDEKETMRKRLPPGRYRFVELVEKGREDWMRSACRKGVRCDVLVVSGHFNAGDTFYSDRIDNPDHLAIDELERAACSDSCPGLFGGLKEVYLFGCESLNPDASKYASSHGESGRGRMRRIFGNVPSIYGFSGAAPVGPVAAKLLGRYFDAGGARDFGTGRAQSRLLAAFSRSGMTRVSGEGPAGAAHRARVCRFFDERSTAGARLAFAHELLREGRIDEYLKRIEVFVQSVTPAERADAGYGRALAAIAADAATRERFLAAARASSPARRARMIALATELEWLDASQRAEESTLLLTDLARSRTLGFEDVDLACTLNSDGSLDGAAERFRAAGGTSTGHAAALACLGDDEARARTLRALPSTSEAEARVARAYLRHRPLRDAAELRPVTRAVANMPGSVAKVRALDTLARLRITDAEALAELERSFVRAESARVQEAIAEVFLRSGARTPGLEAAIRAHRLDRPSGGGVVDSLLSQLGG